MSSEMARGGEECTLKAWTGLLSDMAAASFAATLDMAPRRACVVSHRGEAY